VEIIGGALRVCACEAAVKMARLSFFRTSSHVAI
jgi:hypothetical protein